MLLSQTFKLSNSLPQRTIVNKRNPPTKVSTVKLSFNPQSQNVNNAADAFSYTVSECLKYAYKRKIKLDSFLIDCPYISTSKRDTGYFRSNDSITINNKQFYIGKSHSFDTKVSHINKLCNYLNLAANSICWLYESNVVYKNSWFFCAACRILLVNRGLCFAWFWFWKNYIDLKVYWTWMEQVPVKPTWLSGSFYVPHSPPIKKALLWQCFFYWSKRGDLNASDRERERTDRSRCEGEGGERVSKQGASRPKGRRATMRARCVAAERQERISPSPPVRT